MLHRFAFIIGALFSQSSFARVAVSISTNPVCMIASPYEYMGMACKPYEAGLSLMLSDQLVIDLQHNEIVLWKDLGSDPVFNAPTTERRRLTSTLLSLRKQVAATPKGALKGWLGLGLGASELNVQYVSSLEEERIETERGYSLAPAARLDVFTFSPWALFVDAKAVVPISFAAPALVSFGTGIEFHYSF